jgi:hypothetical protein
MVAPDSGVRRGAFVGYLFPSNRMAIHSTPTRGLAMRAETEAVVDEIKQAISLLRRHL